MRPTDYPDAELPNTPPHESARPFWMTEDLESFAPELQAAITGIVMPAYNDLVLAAKPGVQQSTGLTIVHSMWVEVLYIHEIGSHAQDSTESQERLELIERLLRLTAAKFKAHHFLLRLHEFRKKYGPLTI